MLSKADLHIRTSWSDGFHEPEEIVEKAISEGLKVIAITDHGLPDGAMRAKEYVKRMKLSLDVVVGEEIPTQEGEIIALYLSKAYTLFS